MRNVLHVEHHRDTAGRTRYVVQLAGAAVALDEAGRPVGTPAPRNDDTRATSRPRVSWRALPGSAGRN